MNNSTDIKTIAYEGASAYARFKGIMYCICGTMCICCIYIVAYNMYKSSISYSPIISSIITNADCTKVKDPNGVITYNCNLEVKYTINNINYSGKIVTNGIKSYNVNDKLNIKYNLSNFTDIVLSNNISISYISYGLCCCGLCSCILLYAYVYLLFTSKTFAAVSGAADIADTVF